MSEGKSILLEIAKIDDLAALDIIVDAAKSRRNTLARKSFRAGTLVWADFNTRGTHPAVVKKMAKKNVKVVVLGDEADIPRNSRNWSMAPSHLTIMTGEDELGLWGTARDQLMEKSPWLLEA